VRDMFRIVGLYGQEDVKRTKKRESRRKGDFSLIFPREIASKSGKRKVDPVKKPASGFRWEEIEVGGVAPVTVTEVTKVEGKVEERQVEQKVEGNVDVLPSAPPMVPCC